MTAASVIRPVGMAPAVLGSCLGLLAVAGPAEAGSYVVNNCYVRDRVLPVRAFRAAYELGARTVADMRPTLERPFASSSAVSQVKRAPTRYGLGSGTECTSAIFHSPPSRCSTKVVGAET